MSNFGGVEMIISPSILSADFANLGNDVEKVKQAGAKWVHVDVMDGHFVPQVSYGQPVIQSVRGRSSLPFDVHLMISHPLRYIDDFVKAGADIITFHVECESDIQATIDKIKNSVKLFKQKMEISENAKDHLCRS